MADCDPPATRCDLTPAIAAELAAAGLDDATEVGVGGFGAVYRCQQRSLERTVAVKVLTTDLDPENVEHFCASSVRWANCAGIRTSSTSLTSALRRRVGHTS